MTKILTIPPKLEASIQKNNLVIFVGAGCSMPLGFPSWKKLIEDILHDLNSKYGETSAINFKNILTGIESGKSLFDALNKIENDIDHGPTYKIKSKELINSIIEKTTKELPEKSSVHSLLWKISEKIITTNYDKVLERYKNESISIKIFDNSNAFQVLNNQSEDAKFLYKIHGDYENPDTIILFESDYQNIYKNDNYNNDALSTYFKDKTMLFIGFSLSDPFVNDLFTKIKTVYKGHTINEHFVFTTKNEDFIEYDITPIKINNWEESLIEYLSELDKIKLNKQITNILKTDDNLSLEKELTKDDVSNIVQLITKKTEELLSNPSDKELSKEIKDLRIKLDKLLYEKVDYLQEVDRPFRNADLQILFETIYSTEKLTSKTLEDIFKIRSTVDTYKWYDRSAIVSAITCSLIHFNKADEQKITLLIDFINDNEDKVWQKSISSLFIVLNHLGNKWLRFDSIKNKIKSLNDNSRIQNACSIIVKIFNIGLNNISLVNEDLFANPYFSDSPFNYFLPYHKEENPAFNVVYDTYEGDVEKFIDLLDKLPIPDQLKYIFCSKSKNEIEQEENKNDQDEDALMELLDYNSIFYPFSTYIQEIISFYRYYPLIKHEEKLKSQLKLTETPLKDYLLNAKQKYSALGSHFMRQMSWAQAIVNYKEALKLDGNDIANLLNLASCYSNNKENEKEFSLRMEIKNKAPKNEINLSKLFVLNLNDKKNYEICLEISEELIEIDKKSSRYYNYRGLSLDKLGFKEKSLDDFSEAISINPEIETYYYNRSLYYYEKEEYEKSLIDINKAIDLDKESFGFMMHRVTIYLATSFFEKAFEEIKLADSLTKDKDIDKSEIYNKFSNYYRMQGDFDKAFEYIYRAEELKKQFVFTGTKATIYASMGDTTNFYKFLEIALKDGGDINSLYPDIKNKFKHKKQFLTLIEKYNQKIIS